MSEQYLFGSGDLYGIPLNDASGSVISTPTPVKFGSLQEGSIDVSFDLKKMYGKGQFPKSIARGKGTLTGKAKASRINGALYNSLFFGQTLASGISATYADTVGAAIPATPFAITPTAPSSGTWLEDLGVVSAAGVVLTRIDASGTPATGQYKVAAGVYTFAAADTGVTVFINYRYTATGATASKIAVANMPMGSTPKFRAVLSVPFEGKNIELVVACATSSKLSFATKLDDYSIPELDFEGMEDSQGNVLYFNNTDK